MDPGLEQLLADGGPVLVGGAENVEGFLLVFLHDQLGGFGIRGRADDGGETRGRTVDEFHPAFAEDGVVGGAQPDLAGLFVDLLGVQVEIRVLQIADRLLNFKGEQGGHAGVQQGPEVWQVVLALEVRRQELAGDLQRLLHVLEGFHLVAGQRVDDRQVVGGVGEADLGGGLVFFQCGLE